MKTFLTRLYQRIMRVAPTATKAPVPAPHSSSRVLDPRPAVGSPVATAPSGELPGSKSKSANAQAERPPTATLRNVDPEKLTDEQLQDLSKVSQDRNKERLLDDLSKRKEERNRCTSSSPIGGRRR